MKVYFKVMGKPIGKARPRYSPHGWYTPKSTADYEKKIARAYREVAGDTYFTGKVFVAVMAFYPIPKSWTQKKKLDAEVGNTWPGKPDVDNVMKSVLDGLNGVAYDDDLAVCGVVFVKQYAKRDEEGRLEIAVSDGVGGQYGYFTENLSYRESADGRPLADPRVGLSHEGDA